jgi:dTDP-glucose 4,6-dehydratase
MILITGCLGFIGSNLYNYLSSKGYEVCGIDAGFTGSLCINVNNRKNIDTGNIRFWDYCNQLFIKYPIKKIVHLAAETHVDRSISNPVSFFENNVIGTSCLLTTALKYKIDLFLNVITDEVYGSKDTGLAIEGDPFRPTSPYAASKAAQYFVGKSYAETFGMNIINTFPTNNFGPRQWPEKLIPRSIIRLLNGQNIQLMKSNHFCRDWLYVEDHCRAIETLLNHEVPGDYNIAGNNHQSNLLIAGSILEKLNLPNGGRIDIIEDRLAHDKRYAVDSTKISSIWQPSTNFSQALQNTIEWYKENKDWYPVI